ncbi:hypothetical protein THRCLA_22876, partial [Thraustotheca clavata]
RDFTVRCIFCAFFGRTKDQVGDERLGKKRMRSSRTDIKYWVSFAPQNYLIMKNSIQNCGLNTSFFDAKENIANTLHRHYDLQSDELKFIVSAPIIETIIGDLFLSIMKTKMTV